MFRHRKLSRRNLLTFAATGGAAALAGRLIPPRASAATTPRNAVWVWHFEEDGEDPFAVRDVLARNGLDVILKTADGDSWMDRYDPMGISGGADVRRWADFFESAGVGFHAWCVVAGIDPEREAAMSAEALASGARSMYFDLESPEGNNYWQRGTKEAVVFGQELRRLQPNALLRVAPDARPWKIDEVPVAEFCGFCDEVAPQLYWETFDSPSNYRLLRDHGFEVGPEGVTPELILNAAGKALSPFGLPVRPIGQGAARLDGWQRFVSHAYGMGMPSVSVWRYGTGGDGLWSALQSMPPPQPASALAPPLAASAVQGSTAPSPGLPAAVAPVIELARPSDSKDKRPKDSVRDRLSASWRTLGADARGR